MTWPSLECFLMYRHIEGSENAPPLKQKKDVMSHPPYSVWQENSLMHTKIIAVRVTLVGRILILKTGLDL
jgi:hypothetical protein